MSQEPVAEGVAAAPRPEHVASSPPPVAARGTAFVGLLLGFLTVLAFRSLLGYDPESPHTTVGGTEGFLFEPTGGSPQLILMVSAWMLWTRRRQLAGALGQPASDASVAALVLCCALAAWATYSSAIDLLIPALTLLLLGGAGLVAGSAGVRSVCLPALFLLFAMPFPPALLNFIIYPLQMFTAKATMLLLTLMQIEGFRQGDMIHTPQKIFHVIETCGGMRVMVTLTFSAVVYAELFRRSRAQMLLLMLAAPVIAAVVNVARVLTIVLNPYSDLAPVHTAQGIAMVIIAVLMLAGVDGALLRPMGERAQAPPRRRLRQRPDAIARSRVRITSLSLVLLAIATIPAWVPAWRPKTVIQPPSIYRMPPTLGEWKATAQPVDERFLGSVAFTERLSRAYVRDGEHVDLFLGLDRRLEREAHMASTKTMIPSSGWELIERTEISPDEDGRSARWVVVESRNRQALVLHWYEGVLPVALETVRSLFALDHSPLRRPGYALLVRAATPISPGPTGREEAVARIEEFIAHVIPELAKVDPNALN